MRSVLAFSTFAALCTLASADCEARAKVPPADGFEWEMEMLTEGDCTGTRVFQDVGPASGICSFTNVDVSNPLFCLVDGKSCHVGSVVFHSKNGNDWIRYHAGNDATGALIGDSEVSWQGHHLITHF